MRMSVFDIKKITEQLLPGLKNTRIELFDSIPSTNTYAKLLADGGAESGHTVISASQSAGRGRRGKSFFSPDGSGIYMSIVLRCEKCTAANAAKITTIAAVAICEAIEKISDKKPQIKWVNDIFIANKKVCGILTEAAFNQEDGFMNYAVLGIGINAFMPKNGFPKELKSMAGAVFDEYNPETANILAAEFINCFMLRFADFPKNDYLEEYRRRCLVLGREIQILLPEGTAAATALDIDNECGLIVRMGDGQIKTLSSGEISIKL